MGAKSLSDLLKVSHSCPACLGNGCQFQEKEYGYSQKKVL